MFNTFSILSVALLLTLTVHGSAEEDRNLLSKLNSNIELKKVTANNPVAPNANNEQMKTSETRPGASAAKNDFITSSHTEQSYSSSASFESSNGPAPGSPVELGGGRGPGPVNSPAASSASYQVSGENFAGSSGEVQSQQNQHHHHQQQQSAHRQPQQQQQQQPNSPDNYPSSAEENAPSVGSSQPALPNAYGRPDLNEVDFTRPVNYPSAGARALPQHAYGSSFEMQGQTFDLQRNPEPAYDGGVSAEYNVAQNNVNNEGGYGLSQDISAYEENNSNEDEGSAYRTQDPEDSSAPLAAHGSGPEHHHQQQHPQHPQHQQQQPPQQQQQSQQPQQQQQQHVQQAPSSAEQGVHKTSTLSAPGPVPDYGGFRPVIKSQAIPVPPIPGPQRPAYALGHGEPYRSVSVNYEPPKSIYSYDGLSNTANTGSYNSKAFPVYGGGQGPRDAQPQTPPAPTSHAGYGLDYASGKPYGGDLSVKPYSADPKGNVIKNIPMTIGYDDFVKSPNPSAASYHSAGNPHGPPHHGSDYMVSHGPPQQNYEQGPPPQQGPYGHPPQGPPQQQGHPQVARGYGQPVTYQATPIGYAQPDGYDQQSGPVTYEHQRPSQQGPPPPQQGPIQQGPPVGYGPQSPPVGYEQAGHPQGPQQMPPQGHPQGGPHPHQPQPQVVGQHPPPQQHVPQTPPGYGPPSGPGPVHSGPPPSGPPPQYEQEPSYGPPPQSAAPVNYEQSGPNEYQQTPSKPGYEQTTTFVESSGYPGNLGPSYGTIKDGPVPMNGYANSPPPSSIESYSGNMGSDNEYPSGYDSMENTAGPTNYPAPLSSGYNSPSGNYPSGGYPMPDDSYMSSLFGFPTYDVNSGKGSLYASGSNSVASPSGSHLSGPGSHSGKPSSGSFLPSIKLTGSGLKFTGFGSGLTGGLGSMQQAIASTLGSGLSSVTGPGLGLGSGLGSSLSSTLGGNSGVAGGMSPLHSGSGAVGTSGLGGPLASFYNNLSGLGAPFGNLGGGLNNYGTAASKLIPQAIRAPFRTMYRALMGANVNPNPLNG